MQSTKLHSGDVVANRWIGDGPRGGVPGPVVVSGARTAAAPAESKGTIADVLKRNPGERTWLQVGVRLLRDGCIGLVLLATVPFAVVEFDATPQHHTATSVIQQQLADVERLRALMSPRDHSVTPMQAGRAFHALSAAGPSAPPRSRQTAEFPEQPVPDRSARPWELQTSTGAVRGASRVPRVDHRATSRVLNAAASSLAAEEIRYLRAVAEAPVWAQFDLIARAPRVDVLGGRYVLPFRRDAFAPLMRTTPFADIKALAYAGVARAAYYVAIGDLVRAEAALQSIVGFGFMMIDNGAIVVDAMVGRVVVDIGRDGLHQLYTVARNEKGLRLAEPLPQRVRPAPAPRSKETPTLDAADASRAAALADVRNDRLPVALRYESLHKLSFGSCTSMKGMLLGAPDEERAAFARARSNIARFPAEQAYVSLLEESVDRMPSDVGGAHMSVLDRLAIGTAAVVGTVAQNPRIVACTRSAIMFR